MSVALEGGYMDFLNIDSKFEARFSFGPVRIASGSVVASMTVTTAAPRSETTAALENSKNMVFSGALAGQEFSEPTSNFESG
jgi:hypothetical protein